MTSIDNEPLVSIIIPTKDNTKLLKSCISSIEERSSYKNYEIIIVDNNSIKKETRMYLDTTRHKVLAYDKPFNFSDINNIAVKSAKGDHIIFLNDDTQVISQDWIEKMLEHSVKPVVGAVGALLFYPNNTIQHAGVLVGIEGVTTHAFEGLLRNDPGYRDLVKTVRECSAVTGACMMVKKNIFEDIGGFDRNFSYSFNDVDLCLRLREKGYLIIYTPYAQLYHHGSASRPYTQDNIEVKYFVKLWHNVILAGDPYYDSNLSRIKQFELKTGEENIILTETHLYAKSTSIFKRLTKYMEVTNKVRKRHGLWRLVLEFVRFAKRREL